MSVAKLKAAQKQLENASKSAMRVLNEVSQNAFVHSPAADAPLAYVGWIGQTLQSGIAELEATAKYDGLDEEAIVALKTKERADEADTVRAAAAAALEAYAAKSEPVADTEAGLDAGKTE